MADLVVEVVRSVVVGAGSIVDRVAQERPRIVEVEVVEEHGIDRIVETEECRWQKQEQE